MCLSSQSLYEKAAAGGAAFANAPFMKTFILSILAGSLRFS
jgi:hypothetical protein